MRHTTFGTIEKRFERISTAFVPGLCPVGVDSRNQWSIRPSVEQGQEMLNLSAANANPAGASFKLGGGLTTSDYSDHLDFNNL
ncbi:MAG: hypothetical protein K1Y36_24970 [Blastocatellia bacterium]|nr:hypothetical protein [Blastocatellia bacterium]